MDCINTDVPHSYVFKPLSWHALASMHMHKLQTLNPSSFTVIAKGLAAFKSHIELAKIFPALLFPEFISMLLTVCSYLHFQFANRSWKRYEHCNAKVSLYVTYHV